MNNTTYNVKNRSASVVVCRIPELNTRKEFAPGETLRMTADELEKLNFQPGGRELIANFLQILDNNAEAINNNLGIHCEAEYFMNEQQIAELLRNGDIAAFEDCLDFAPMGVVDLVKQLAVQLPLTDTRKIQVLKDKTGFDVAKALENAAGDSEAASEPVKTNPARRTTANYKIVSKG